MGFISDFNLEYCAYSLHHVRDGKTLQGGDQVIPTNQRRRCIQKADLLNDRQIKPVKEIPSANLSVTHQVVSWNVKLYCAKH